MIKKYLKNLIKRLEDCLFAKSKKEFGRHIEKYFAEKKLERDYYDRYEKHQ